MLLSVYLFKLKNILLFQDIHCKAREGYKTVQLDSITASQFILI